VDGHQSWSKSCGEKSLVPAAILIEVSWRKKKKRKKKEKKKGDVHRKKYIFEYKYISH
jgi:hypothetical protein